MHYYHAVPTHETGHGNIVCRATVQRHTIDELTCNVGKMFVLASIECSHVKDDEVELTFTFSGERGYKLLIEGANPSTEPAA